MASAGAVLLRLMAFQTTAAAGGDDDLNYLQYVLPMFVIGLIGILGGEWVVDRPDGRTVPQWSEAMYLAPVLADLSAQPVLPR